MTDLKMFEQTQGMCLETPLERFLTPDACSDTSYFARLALTQMGTSFSCMEGREQRSKKAKENVLAARRNGKPRGESQTAQGKSCRMDKRIGRLS